MLLVDLLLAHLDLACLQLVLRTKKQHVLLQLLNLCFKLALLVLTLVLFKLQLGRQLAHRLLQLLVFILQRFHLRGMQLGLSLHLLHARVEFLLLGRLMIQFLVVTSHQFQLILALAQTYLELLD